MSRGEAEATTLHEALERYELEVTPGKKTAAGERSFLRIWKATTMAKQPSVACSFDAICKELHARFKDQWSLDCSQRYIDVDPTKLEAMFADAIPHAAY